MFEVVPKKMVDTTSKWIYTGCAVGITLVANKMPLYGVRSSSTMDPFYWFRAIMASSKGTLMELGISPNVTSSMLVSMLTNSKMMKLSPKAVTWLEKGLTVLIAAAQASAYVIGGYYGPIGILNGGLIVLQLVGMSTLVMMMDQLLQSGYGFGSATSLFSAVNFCESVMWHAFSPVLHDYGHGPEFEGAVLSLLHTLLVKPRRVISIFTRTHLPNFWSLILTMGFIALITFLQVLHVNVPIIFQNRGRGQNGTYPISLFYTSGTPVMLLSALVSNIQMFSQLIFKMLKSGLFVNMLGRWVEHQGHYVPVGGLVYYILPPLHWDLFHMVFYLCFTTAVCAILSRLWIQVSGLSSSRVAEEFKEKGITIPGHTPTSTRKYLNKYINLTAAVGGFTMGLLTVLSDYTNVIGSGATILLATNVITNITKSNKY